SASPSQIYTLSLHDALPISALPFCRWSARPTADEPADARCVREAPWLDVGDLDAKAGEDGADLLAVNAAVVEHLSHHDAGRTLVRPEVEEADALGVELDGEERLPESFELVDAVREVVETDDRLARLIVAPRLRILLELPFRG